MLTLASPTSLYTNLSPPPTSLITNKDSSCRKPKEAYPPTSPDTRKRKGQEKQGNKKSAGARPSHSKLRLAVSNPLRLVLSQKTPKTPESPDTADLHESTAPRSPSLQPKPKVSQMCAPSQTLSNTSNSRRPHKKPPVFNP